MFHISVVLTGNLALVEGHEQGDVGIDKEKRKYCSNPPREHDTPQDIDTTENGDAEYQPFVESWTAKNTDRCKDYPANVLDDQYPKD